jgi:hypothetical protein
MLDVENIYNITGERVQFFLFALIADQCQPQNQSYIIPLLREETFHTLNQMVHLKGHVELYFMLSSMTF